jgi:hypothetical protein
MDPFKAIGQAGNCVRLAEDATDGTDSRALSQISKAVARASRRGCLVQTQAFASGHHRFRERIDGPLGGAE